MSEIKLLPCPCCAEKEHIHIRNFEDFNKDFSSTYKHYVECGVCGLKTEMFASIEEVVEKWNTRKPMERIIERLEESKDAKCFLARMPEQRLRGSDDAYDDAIEICKEEGGIE